jgi:hypothetical protein
VRVNKCLADYHRRLMPIPGSLPVGLSRLVVEIPVIKTLRQQEALRAFRSLLSAAPTDKDKRRIAPSAAIRGDCGSADNPCQREAGP